MELVLKHLDIISFRGRTDPDGPEEMHTAMVHSCQFPGFGDGALVYAVGDNGKEWLVPVVCVLTINKVKLSK